jgi:hypothetical protein
MRSNSLTVSDIGASDGNGREPSACANAKEAASDPTSAETNNSLKNISRKMSFLDGERNPFSSPVPVLEKHREKY